MKLEHLSRRNLLKNSLAISTLSAVPRTSNATTLANKIFNSRFDRITSEINVPNWSSNVDVLILGFGCTGAAAAIEAAQNGAKVLIVDCGSTAGGTSAMSGGVIYCGGGTAIQKTCGFDDSVEAMRAYLMASTGAGPDTKKIDTYCEQSTRHFDWLVSTGVPFKKSYWPHNFEPTTNDCLWYSGSELCHPYSKTIKPAPRGHTVQMEGSLTAGRLMMEIFSNFVNRLGIQSHFNTEAKALIQASDGNIVGATVLHGNEIHHIRAKGGVILATGGFIMNRDMVALYAPQAKELSPLGSGWDTGSGILLGTAAGGATINMHAIAYTCPALTPTSLIKGLLLNAQGQRFINEDVNHKRIGEFSVLRQDGRIYLLKDSSINDQPSQKLPVVAVAETPEELEATLGAPRFSIENTLNFYNRYAAEGLDPLFKKKSEFVQPLIKPPYTLFDCSLDSAPLYSGFTLGGLHTRVSGEVLCNDGSEIPGLYAAGRATSCLSAQSCGSSGLQLGEGTFFGRLAGRSAAANA